MHLQWIQRYNLLIFDEVDSTNLESKRLALGGAEGNFVIWAKHQTHGKGRYGKTWESLSDNLYLSILLDASTFIQQQTELSFVTALAIYNVVKVKALSHEHKYNIALKWPNDVMVNSSKIAGILLESVKVGAIHHLIIGIGLNVHNHPNDLGRLTTSMSMINNECYDLGEILDLTISSFEYYYTLWRKKGFSYIRKLWLQKIYNPHETMMVSDGHNRISGVFKDIDLNGAIRLQLASGQIYTLSTGEVFICS